MSSENEQSDEKDFEREWKIASTAMFVRNFGEFFKLPEVEIETLEEGLLNQTKYGIHVVKNLVVALVKRISPNRGVRPENYARFLRKTVDKIWIEEKRQEENPLKEDTNFEDITALSKLDIIDSLCYHLLHKTAVKQYKDYFAKMNGDFLRVQPLGCDDEGNEYWYFYGTRLYKQEASKDRKIKDWEEEWNTQKNTSLVKRGRGRPRKTKPRKSDGESDESEEALTDKSKHCTSDLGEKSRWSVVCNTLNDWVEFAEKFKDSKSKCEKALFRTLTDDFLPVMNEAYQAKEKKLQQKLRELIPKPTFTKMETRQRRTKSTSDISKTGDVDKVSSREQRLEERNRRLNESVESGSKRRSRSRISYDESYDDFDDESSKRSRKRSFDIENYDEMRIVKATSKRLRNRLSYLENGEIDLVEASKSKHRESIEAKANEVLKEYASVTSSSSNNKSQILRVLTQLKLDKNSYPFHYSVDRNEFPDYLDIISDPMDLARIDRKLRLNIYKTAAEVDEDFKLMVENCELYFGVDSDRSKMGRHTWRLFRRLMFELANPPKQNESSAVPNETGGNENLNKEKRVTDTDSERSERAKKKRKYVNTEALDILSRESELALERSKSMDEEHFRNFTQKDKKLTQFSDLIVEPIHSHPSDLIQKFMSDSSSQGNDDSNSNDYSSTGNQNSNDPPSVHQSSPENLEANGFNNSHEENSNSSQSMDKNDPKTFNILSSDNEASLGILSENDMYPHSLSNCLPTDLDANRDKKSDDEDLNNLSGSCDDSNGNNIASNFVGHSSNLNTSLSSNSFESYHSPNSSCPGSSPKDSVNGSPQHTENNNTYLNGFGYTNFTHEDEPNGSSTVDASCLGLASANIYKKQQHENEPKTSVAQNFSEASVHYNGNQNSYDGFSKLNSRKQVFSKNQPKIRSPSSDDQMIEELFPRPEISRGKPDSPNQAFQGMQAPLVNLESSKSPPAYSYSSHQFIQGQNESQPSKTEFQRSAVSSEPAIQHETQKLKHSEKEPRWSPPFLVVEKIQNEGNIETQPNCSSAFNANGEVDDLEHSRTHQTCPPSNNFTLLQGQRLPEQEVSNHSGKNNQRSSPAASFSQEMQEQISGNDRAKSPTYNMQQEVQDHLLVIQEQSKVISRQLGLFPNQEIQVSEMDKLKYTQTSSFPSAALKDQDSAESQQGIQRHSLHPSRDETQKQKTVKNQVKQVSNPMRFNSQQEEENGENNRSKLGIFAFLSANQQLKNQNSLKSNAMYWDQNFAGSQPRYSPTLSAHQEINHQQPTVNQPRFSPTLSAHQEMNHQQPSANQPRYSPTASANQEMNHQQPAINQPRYSPTLSAHQEMNHQQPSLNQPRYSPTVSVHQEMNHQQPAANQPRYSPTVSANQEMNHQHPGGNQPRYSPTVSINQELNNQKPAKDQPRYSPTMAVHQEMNNQQPSNNQRRCSPNLSAKEAMNHHQTAENQFGCPPSAFTQQKYNKKSAKTQGNSAFLKSQTIEEQDSIGVQSNYLPAFSNQGAFVQEPARNSVQHMQNQVPVEAPPFDFDNIFANSFSTANTTAQVEEPPFTVNSVMQIQPPVSTSHFNQNQTTKPIFPTMKLRLPPSTGELIVVPGDPSSMTFHLLAKPLSDPSQPIQSSMKIHATNQMRNQEYQDNSNNESGTARSQNPSKQDAAQAPRKRISPIQDLEQLASNPRKSSNSPSSHKKKNYNNVSHSSRSVESSLKSPPAITNDFSVIKPNAVLVRPLESSANSLQQQHARNNSSLQQSAFVQQSVGPRTVIFPRGNQMTNVMGSSPISTNSLSAMPMNVDNGQRHIIPNTLPNTVMQNGSGQYVFVPSKDIIQSNVDQSSKMKNSESPPQFYPSNMMPSFPFQNGQMNPVQMLPQVHLPYVNPYYIVANPSAFQNASRYPVMNMQPIPFQNR